MGRPCSGTRTGAGRSACTASATSRARGSSSSSAASTATSARGPTSRGGFATGRSRPGSTSGSSHNLNPDGRRLGTRLNGRGVDLNRNFGSEWIPIGRRWDPRVLRAAALVRAGDAAGASAGEARAARRRRSGTTSRRRSCARGVGAARRRGATRVSRASRTAPFAGRTERLRTGRTTAFPGTASFVVELPAGRLAPAAAARHARAVRLFSSRLLRNSGRVLEKARQTLGFLVRERDGGLGGRRQLAAPDAEADVALVVVVAQVAGDAQRLRGISLDDRVSGEELDDLRPLCGPAPGAEAEALLHVAATARARRHCPVSVRRSRDLDKAGAPYASAMDPIVAHRSYSRHAMAGAGRDERAWVRGAQAGSASDFEALFRAHWPRAYRAAFLVVHDAAGAEDVAQEALPRGRPCPRSLRQHAARSAPGSTGSSSTARSTGPGRGPCGARSAPARRSRTSRPGAGRSRRPAPRGRPRRARVALARPPGGRRAPLRARVHAGRDRADARAAARHRELAASTRPRRAPGRSRPEGGAMTEPRVRDALARRARPRTSSRRSVAPGRSSRAAYAEREPAPVAPAPAAAPGRRRRGWPRSSQPRSRLRVARSAAGSATGWPARRRRSRRSSGCRARGASSSSPSRGRGS